MQPDAPAIVSRGTSTPRHWWRRAAAASLPVILWTLFVSAHLHHFARTGSGVGLVIALQELLVLYWFIARRPVQDVSANPVDWLFAGLVTFSVLFLRPSGSPLFGAGLVWSTLQIGGAVLGCAASLSLGRSFGLVAANRGVKSSGAYAFVRHPLYATYCLTWVGYLGTSPSLRNAVVFVIAFGGQLVRIAGEERVLMRDPEYARYVERVRWRLVPGLV